MSLGLSRNHLGPSTPTPLMSVASPPAATLLWPAFVADKLGLAIASLHSAESFSAVECCRVGQFLGPTRDIGRRPESGGCASRWRFRNPDIGVAIHTQMKDETRPDDLRVECASARLGGARAGGTQDTGSTTLWALTARGLQAALAGTLLRDISSTSCRGR